MPPQTLAPEARDLLELFAQRVELSNAQMIKDVRDHVDRSLGEVKTELRGIRDEVTGQGKDLATIKTRLDEGEKRFAQLEKRVDESEKTGNDSAKGVAYLSGAVAAGAAFGGSVSAVVQYLMK